MTDVLPYFSETMDWIKIGYTEHRFFVERDFVWTVQKKLTEILLREQLPYSVFNDYPIVAGTHRSKSVDLAIVGNGIKPKDILTGKAQLELAIEFKFEPSKMRSDILVHKLPVVFWSAVSEDINRIKSFTENHSAKAGIAVFIDEFGRYRNTVNYPIDSHSQWIDWGACNSRNLNISVLMTACY